MKTKILSIFICTLFITIVLPASGNLENIEGFMGNYNYSSSGSIIDEKYNPGHHLCPNVIVDNKAHPNIYSACYVRTLQEGIDNCSANGGVIVYSSPIPYGRVNINWPIKIFQGWSILGAESPTIAGEVLVTESVEFIRNFTFTSKSNGIHLKGVSDISLSECKFENNHCGIYLTDSNRNTIKNCNITNCFESGIDFTRSNYNVIEYCNISHITNKHGIYINQHSNHNEIRNCNITYVGQAGTGIFILSSSDHNKIIHCNISHTKASGIAIASSSHNNISYCNILSNIGWDGVHVYASSNILPTFNTINHCNISNTNFYGIQLVNSKDNNITYCNISDTGSSNIGVLGSDNNNFNHCNISDTDGSGFYLKYSWYNNFSHCNISDTHNGGIFLNNSDKNNFAHCNISSTNPAGIFIDYSDHNKFKHCNISDTGIDGILVVYSNNNTIQCNISHIDFHGIEIINSNDNDFTSCNISHANRSGIYSKDSDDNDFTNCNISHTNYSCIYLADSDDNDFTNCNISHTNYSGIWLSNSDYNNSFIHCNISHTKHSGVYQKNSDYNNFYYCNISHITGNGFLINRSKNNEIRHCKLSDINQLGIYLVKSSKNTIYRCNITLTDKSGISLDESTHNIISFCNITHVNGTGIALNLLSPNNNIHNCSIIHTNQNGVKISKVSSYTTITDCTISFTNSSGIYIESSNHNDINNCNIICSEKNGLEVDGQFLNITKCYINNNKLSGIYLKNAYKVIISSCNITYNGRVLNSYGIELINCEDNLIYNNYLKDNNINAYDNKLKNKWNIAKKIGLNIIGGSFLGGNYWGDYRGKDLDGDGLGDIPYDKIRGGSINEDKHPLCSDKPDTLRFLTHNVQLLPYPPSWYPKAAKEVSLRAAIAGSRVNNGDWDQNYDIICLQEVFLWFNTFGRNPNSPATTTFYCKNALVRGFLKDPKIDLSQNRLFHNTAHWFSLDKTKTITLNPHDPDDQAKVELLNANPEEATVNQIAILKRGERYVVTGPDELLNKLRLSHDGGLMILSKYPVLKASGFIFSRSEWVEKTFSNKGALYARIQLEPENPDFYIHIFNTHLVARKEQENIRTLQIYELRSFIKKCIADDKSNHPILLCGDFNIIGGSSEYMDLLLTLQLGIPPILELEDEWIKQNNKDEPKKDAGTWVGSDIPLPDNSPWGPKDTRNVLASEKGDFERLDYIFCFRGKNGPDAISPYILQPDSIKREPAGCRTFPLFNFIEYKWGVIWIWKSIFGYRIRIPVPGRIPYIVQSYTISDHIGVGADFLIIPK